MITQSFLTRIDRTGYIFLAVMVAVMVLVPLSNLLMPAGSFLQVSNTTVTLVGKYLTYALLAIAVDLVWGYCGILSLGHGAFFALGGYAMGMYLMRQIGPRGVYANPILPDFMVFLNWKELPITWWGFSSFPYAMLMWCLCRAAGARVWLVRLPLARHRRLSVDHHAGHDLRAAAGLFPQRYGLWRQQRPDRFQGHSGFSVQSQTTRAVLFALSALAVILGYLVTRYITTSKAGKVIIAVRDAEARTRFTGYRVEHYKLFVFVVSAVLAGIAGRSMCRRSASSTRRNSRQPTRSRSSSGWRSAGADAGRRSARRTGRQRSEKLVHRRVPGPVAVCPWRPVRGDDALSAEGDSRDGAGLDRAGARPAGRKRAGEAA